jgi:hypothetical protein
MDDTSKTTSSSEELARQREEAFARLAEIRRQIGRLPGFSSTEIIRQQRDKRTEHLYRLVSFKTLIC